MKKHRYEIAINQLSEEYAEVTYDYSANRGKGIKLQISDNAVFVVVFLSALYEADAVVTAKNHIITDAIKKALLLHLVMHSKGVQIVSATVAVDGGNPISIMCKDGSQPLYSLIAGELVRRVPEKWSDPVFLNALVSRTQSGYDPRWSAAFAALYARSKTYEVERFLYLWMAFNGVYGYFANRVNALRPRRKDGKKQKLKESESMQWLLRLYGLGRDTVSAAESKRIANEVRAVLREFDISSIRSLNDLPRSLAEKIEAVLVRPDGSGYDLTARGYLLTSFAYYHRCGVFHADKSLPLFCYADDIDLKCLRLINTLLEQFIDEQLPLIFDEAYVQETFGAKIELLANLKK